MTIKLPKRGLPPMHPGELLREEILPALNRPKTVIAKLLGVSPLNFPPAFVYRFERTNG